MLSYSENQNVRSLTIRMPTVDEMEAMSAEDLARWLENVVYAATEPVERMEYHGKFSGNGHHMRQHMARFAADLVRERARSLKSP